MERSWIRTAAIVAMLTASCKHEPLLPGYRNSGYPDKIGKIMIDKCAVAGCHNNTSYDAAAGLNLTTWQQLFNGANSGSVIIPFRPEYSPICYFTNTDKSLGIVLSPTMPIDQSPLSKQEYLRMKEWINEGAPSATGEVMFANSAGRSKFYVTNRMCDVVTVFDSELSLQMNYVDVGVKPEREFPYCVKLAPDKTQWYVSFYAPSDIVHQFDCNDDKLVKNIYLGQGMWHSFAITSDSKFGFFIDNASTGRIAYVDLDRGVVIAEYNFDGQFKYLSGVALNETLKKLYVGTLTGNFIYCIDIDDPLHAIVKQIPIDGTGKTDESSSMAPVELIMAPDGRCFIGCTGSREVRIVDVQKDTLIGTISLHTPPAFMAYAVDRKYLFVTCPDDDQTFAGNRGSVVVINPVTQMIVSRINTGYQPYGIAVDEAGNRVVVVNANISSAGLASHHASRCGEKNGNVSFIDINTLTLIPGKKREVAVFPFSVAIR